MELGLSEASEPPGRACDAYPSVSDLARFCEGRGVCSGDASSSWACIVDLQEMATVRWRFLNHTAIVEAGQETDAQIACPKGQACVQIKPCRSAYATECVRLRRFRRLLTSWTTFFTVRSDRNSWPPTSAVSIPSASSRSTFTSRSVSPENVSPRGASTCRCRRPT